MADENENQTQTPAAEAVAAPEGERRGRGGRGRGRDNRGGNSDGRGRRDDRRGNRDEDQGEVLIEKLVHTNRVSKTGKGGKRFVFASIGVGGEGKCRVGFGYGKERSLEERRVGKGRGSP